MYIKMITVLFVALMWEHFASSVSQDLMVVNTDGTAIPVHKKTLCYLEWYDVQCDKDWFAPIRNIFSLKDPAFSLANNCTGQKPYPKQCCNVDPTDCNFTSIKDFDQIRRVCSGHTYCKGQRAPWHPVYENKPNMHCPYQQRLTNVLTTQYVTTEYMCVPYRSMQHMCSKGTKHGKGLFLSSKDYPAYYPEHTGFNCSCQVVFGAHAVLKVAAIDLRLCSNSGRCGRTLNIGDAPPISVTNTMEEDPSLSSDSIFGIVGMKEIYSAASTTGHVKMELTDVDSKEDLYLWMYLYAEGSDMTVTCDDETTFTTPYTTTTTTTTTTPTTLTSPTTPTRSTTPTTPTTQVSAKCPNGWITYDSSCYRLFRTTHQAWPKAVFECEKHDALLASFETKAENNHISEMMEIFNVSKTDNIWIGISKVREEGVFVWESTRQKATYLPWGKNEPNQATTQEDCVMLFGQQDHTFADDTCSAKYPYLCEKHLDGGLPIIG